jgi:hypothetical protein
MKVIEKGRDQKGWSIEQVCTGNGNGGGGCGAKLLVERADLYGTARGYIDGSSDYFTTFKCTLCGVETDIPDSKVPGNIARSLHQRRR